MMRGPCVRLRSVVMTLPSFLLARIEDEEQRAREMTDLHAANRLLIDCEARRRIVSNESTPGHILGLLALPYANHPDYRAEWRP